MHSHRIDYRILGDDIQLVEIELDPLETVIAEAGSMMYMDNDIRFETRMGDGSDPNQGLMDKLISAGTRVLTGESLFVTHFTNQGVAKQRVAFAAPYPGKIVPVDLGLLPLCGERNQDRYYPEQEDRSRVGRWRGIYS
jgi:uncharacterized protein (AIM24 family)